MFTEDLDKFLDSDVFAESVTYTPAVGLPTTITGIFDNADVMSFGGGEGFEGTRPVFTCKSSDVAADPTSETLTIRGTIYEVVGVEPDGTGVSVLVLREA